MTNPTWVKESKLKDENSNKIIRRKHKYSPSLEIVKNFRSIKK